MLMSPENKQSELQELRLENRKKLSVCGVREVGSFDENVIALETSLGLLVVRGEDLHLQSLSVEGGQVVVIGTIHSLTYEALRKSGGFFKRLFT